MTKIAVFPIEGPLDLSQFEVLVCAGGGNRCWWPVGLQEVLSLHGFRPA